MDTAGKERLGQLEKVTLMYIYYTYKINSWKLLYNIGSPVWCSVMTYRVEWVEGEKPEGGDMYIILYKYSTYL